jgi:signal transduction histidine kinase/ActR/RegA family two-component response regulator
VGLRERLDLWRRYAQRPWVAALLQTVIVGGTATVSIALLSLSAQRVLLADLRRSLGQTAVTAAALMDGDAHRRYLAAGHVTPADYAAAVRPLQLMLRSNPDLRFAYSAILRGNRMHYVFDADPVNGSAFLEADPEAPLASERTVWASQRLTVEETPTPTSWGVGLRAYAPIRDSNNRMVAYVGLTMRAERYAAVIDKMRSATRLGTTVAMLLALISGIWMWRAQRSRNQALHVAMAASRAKSEFLATMSHEIRTPLNGVLGMNELLLRSNLPPQQRRWAESVAKAGRHLLAIINDVLDFSKIEAGQLELEAVDFDLVELVEGTVGLFSESAHDKALELLAEFTPPRDQALPVRGDPLRLRQILANLLANAIKFTERGRVVVRVALDERTAGSVNIHLSVADSGIGIAPAAQSTIFEQFAQADGSTTRRFGGTGLGLAICRRLSDRMGGTLSVRSSLGQGSEFSLVLRLPHAANPVTESPASARAPSALLKGSVLLVEDTLINQEITHAMLTALGLNARLASNGQEALDQMRVHDFDLVLMDCQMPVMDGYEATAAIRALPNGQGKRLPIIAVTANAMPGDAQKCLDAGMNAYLAKPFTMEQLRQILVRWLLPRVDVSDRAVAAHR